MVHKVEEPKAMVIKVGSKDIWYRCNKCNDMFQFYEHFDGIVYWDTVPKFCPNCGEHFINGGIKL